MGLPLQNQTDPVRRVPWNQLIAYGMGGVIPIALFNIAGQLMGLLGNISLGLSAFWLGTILIIPRLWDAISDPIIGHFSDNTRTRWGRRRPFILVGGIAVAVTFVAMWWVPRGEFIRGIFPSETAYNWFQLAFILGGLLAFFTAASIFEIPHGALGMEISDDYHERTRLFSAKSFFGNLCAMGTPWLLLLASLEFFRGPGGNLTSGMRYVSLLIAAILIPMSVWWFFVLKEPSLTAIETRKKSAFWQDMRTTLRNKTFLNLVAIIFTLAMGFNFVGLFNYYITIFYLYGGDAVAAVSLLGWGGTVWAVTGLVAVFPLNWMSRRIGKNRTLLFSILLMCAAQLSKIFCYDPEIPYLVLIPTILLSAGMLMFFTLASSMVGDVCDEDELKRNTRAEGTYYSVFWWFIQMGTAFASFVGGALLVYTTFDEKQNVMVDALSGSVAAIRSEAELWTTQNVAAEVRSNNVNRELSSFTETATKLASHLADRVEQHPEQEAHTRELILQLNSIRAQAEALRAQSTSVVEDSADVVDAIDPILQRIKMLKQQSSLTLFRLRVVEIGVPLLLSIVSIVLTLRYPLTEARCYEIEQALRKRREEQAIQ